MTLQTSQPFESMTSVCYRCFYQLPADSETHCPACKFPLIHETELTSEKHLEDIFARSSVATGAPRLPGIAPRPAPRPAVAKATEVSAVVAQRQEYSRGRLPTGRVATHSRLASVEATWEASAVQRSGMGFTGIAVVILSSIFAGLGAALINGAF